MTMENSENMIEFISGRHNAVVSFTNRKHINRIKEIHDERPDEFKYYYENDDGSICASIPLKWVKINPGAKRDENRPKKELSPEHKEKLLAGLAQAREKKNKTKKK